MSVPHPREDATLLVRRFDDVPAFLDRAGAWLEAREAEHNLIFGIVSSLAEDPSISDGAPLLSAVERGGAIVAVAIQTPPWNLVLSEIDDPKALDRLVDDLAADHRPADIPGVLGPVVQAGTFAGLWARRVGVRSRHDMGERIFRLTAVRSPRPVDGSRRVATEADRQLLIDWFIAFHDEAFGRQAPNDAPTLVERWLRPGTRTMWLWEVDGHVVSMCGWGGRTPNGTRIGPVYTPPDIRGRGYASNLVADASQAALDAGRRFCFLFTDLDNPTSNHIYQEIGYQAVADVAAYLFEVDG